MNTVFLVSYDKHITVNGRRLPKNEAQYGVYGDDVAIFVDSLPLVPLFEKRNFELFRINGATPATLQELIDWMDANFFVDASQGGGGAANPESVLYTHEIVLNKEELNGFTGEDFDYIVTREDLGLLTGQGFGFIRATFKVDSDGEPFVGDLHFKPKRDGNEGEFIDLGKVFVINDLSVPDGQMRSAYTDHDYTCDGDFIFTGGDESAGNGGGENGTVIIKLYYNKIII